ncbi:MAG: hypothetical protein A3J93_00775 [Candidatus Magasanikbacteria bacterium RIFOXYC2_FULL_42_28]|uniref:Multidrug ABC transporter substrate-binding protein n=1 Tax=Candidatus Magasanikbacteria bacterium RIFOXYC2_FULL_42_28 TaxID=1798704 RepID=A0A1F6NXE8_9BACT|nr:MAG: hypothetical protein A3J93_00775 [Candidatus Magasanikbacteria bacterium RIFOXYC2_FULL_42_28]
MHLLDNIHAIWRVLGRNKIRSFLTMLGVIIGVMSVIIVLSAGAGAQGMILNQVKSLGSDLIGVLPGASDEKGPPASAMGIVVTTLKDSDIRELIRSGSAHVVAGTGYVKGTDTIVWGDNQTDTSFTGVNASIVEVENAKVENGRFFTEEEERSMARVAVLGSTVAKELFGEEDPVGAQIKIKKSSFNVIGVMKTRGVSGFQNQDDQIFVPLNTAQKLLLGIDYISFARLKVDNPDNVDAAMEDARIFLRERHKIDRPEEDDFSVRSMAQGLEAITQITNALKLFLAAVAAIALVVGGVGIMNIMLAAVQERTREIGLRKAVGATNRNIIEQFLVETVMITFIGGVIGIISGIFISYIISLVVRSLGYDWDFIISIPSIVLGCVVSVGIGMLFGIVPARKAAKLNPIEALRYE